MPILRYLCVALASALVAAYAAIWLVSPAPLERSTATIPPLRIAQGDNLSIWGGWRTVEGYDHGTTTGVEIICSRERQTSTPRCCTTTRARTWPRRRSTTR